MDDLGPRIRMLRQQRGLSQRKLTGLIGLSAHSNLADYESGRRLPPQDVVEACERALDVDDGELSALRRVALVARAAHTERSDAEPVDTERPDAERPDTERPDTESAVAGRIRPRKRIGRIVAAAVVIAAIGWVGVRGADSRPGPVSAAMGLSTCDSTAVILDSAPLIAAPSPAHDTELMGTVSLRYSPSCSLAWARFLPSQVATRTGGGVVLSVHRVSDSATTMLKLSQVVAAESDPLLTVPGCVYAQASVTFAGGVTATARTTCRQH